MKKILTIIATVTAITGATEKFTAKVCPLSTDHMVSGCKAYREDVLPRFEANTVTIFLDGGKFVIYNLAGWSIQISN